MTIVLLTGAPGSGKTTAVQRIVAALQRDADGFTTREIRKSRARWGFEIVTLDGQDGLLAHVEIRGGLRVGRYGVDLSALEEIGIERIEAAVRRGALVVIDEIGPMEILSAPFRQAVGSGPGLRGRRAGHDRRAGRSLHRCAQSPCRT